VSGHSAYDKAAQYFNIKLWRVPVDKNFKADVKAIRRHINKNTILVCTFFFFLFERFRILAIGIYSVCKLLIY